MKTSLRYALFLAMPLWLAAGGAEERVLKVYPLAAVDPETASNVVQAVLGTNATVLVDRGNHRILVLAGSAGHKTLAGLMRELDVPPRNVRIDVRFRTVGGNWQAGAALDTSGTVVRVPTSRGSKLVIRPQVSQQDTRNSQDTVQMLVVSSGKEAELFIGEEVPFFEELVNVGRNWGVIEQEVTLKPVGAKLAIRPTVLSDGVTVAVRVTPELSALVEGKTQTVRYERVATDVLVADGQSIQLGGLGEKGKFYRQFLIGVDRAGTQRDLEITLTPHILDPGGR